MGLWLRPWRVRSPVPVPVLVPVLVLVLLLCVGFCGAGRGGVAPRDGWHVRRRL